MVLKRVVAVVQAFTILVAALSVALLVLRQPAEQPAAARAGAGGSAVATDGRALYLAQCAACHGEAGEGTYAPALNGGAVVRKYPSAADQAAVVAGGVAGTPMKAFGPKLTPEEIEAVVAYTRGL